MRIDAVTNLSEFLLARIADDKDLARTFLADNHAPLLRAGATFRETTVAFVARALAECDAKRAVIKWLTAVVELPDEGWQDDWDQVFATYSATRALEALALAYADHPDHDPAWRP